MVAKRLKAHAWRAAREQGKPRHPITLFEINRTIYRTFPAPDISSRHRSIAT
jgi:hypothetical protein